jgi:hypothetical protein
MKLISRIGPEKVISLTITNKYWPKDETKVFFSVFNGLRFNRLRSLIVKEMRGKELEYLLQSVNADSLVALSIPSWNYPNDQTWIIVSYALARWNLEKLSMSNVDYITEHMPWSDQGRLEHLVIADCAYSKYLLILLTLPNLRTLVMRNCTVDEKIVPSMSSTSTFHLSLKSLTMTGCSLTLEHLESLLSPISSLRYLKLISHRKEFDSIFHGSYWERLICAKLPQLDRFEYFFSYNSSRNDNFISLDSIIDQFRTPFWLHEKRWFVHCAYYLKTEVISLYTIPIVINGNQNPSRCEISSIDNTYRLTQRPLNNMVDNTSDEVCNRIHLWKN